MNLAETLKAIRDDKLDLPQVESYRDALIHFKTDLHRAIADLKKKRALFLVKGEGTAISRKMSWDATDEGQRLLELQGAIAGLAGEIDALQTRIYGLIR